MRRATLLHGAATLIAAVAIPTLTLAQPVQSSRPLPAQEAFVASDDLALTLVTAPGSVRLGERPAFTLRFENRGARRLYVVPPSVFFGKNAVPSRVTLVFERLTTVGAAVSPTPASQARRVPVIIKLEQLVSIAPGQRWETPLDPRVQAAQPLAPGEHTVRVVYTNYPDYDYVHYDPFRMPAAIWEGTVASTPVRFTVALPAPDDFGRLIEGLSSPAAERVAAARLLAVAGPQGVAALLDRLTRRDGRVDSDVLFALRYIDPPPLRELMAAVETLSLQERGSFLGSAAFHDFVGGRVTCELLSALVPHLGAFYGPLPYHFSELFRAGSATCAAARPPLRDAMLDSTGPIRARGHAAALLGTFRHPDDERLLIDVLQRRLSGIPPATSFDGDPIGVGAAMGLRWFTSKQVIDALAAALRDESRQAFIGRAVVDALFHIGQPDVIPPLIEALSSPNPNLVIAIVGRLDASYAVPAVPRLLTLLRHNNPTIRSYAASAIRRLGDGSVRESMLAALKDANSDVQTSALFYLAEHGDDSLRDLFIAGLQSPRQSIREAAIDGIRRFGTADDFPRIRRLFDVPSDQVRGYLPSALSGLTFTLASYPSDSNPKFWDDWYAQHGRASRVDWAREALARTDQENRASSYDASPQRGALEFLVLQRDPRFAPDFERAAQTTRYGVRVEAARAIATYDRRAAGRLLIREFSSRFYGACDAANRALNRLTGLDRPVNCLDPTAKREAATAWEAVLRTL
jgi:HEAT repeats